MQFLSRNQLPQKMRTWEVVYVENEKLYQKITSLNEAAEKVMTHYTVRIHTKENKSVYIVEKSGKISDQANTLVEGYISVHKSTDIRLVFLAMIEALGRLKEHSEFKKAKIKKPVVEIIFQNGKYLYQMQILNKNIQGNHLNPVSTSVKSLKLKNMELQLEIIRLNQDFIFKYGIDNRMMILDAIFYNSPEIETYYDYNYEQVLQRVSKSARSSKSLKDESDA